MQVYQDIEGGGLRANAINRTNQTVEQQIWSFFRSKGYSSEGIAGIMGNFQAESALIPNNVQNGYGWSDADYTQQVDSGAYSKDKFVHDSIGYGLAQWTWWTYKRDLYELAKQRGTSIGNLDTQLTFADNAFSNASWGNQLKRATDVRAACDLVLEQYERPAVYNYDTRRAHAYAFYNKYSGYTAPYISSTNSLYGTNQPTATDRAIQWAVAQCNKGYTYSMTNRWGPTSYDCSAFIISAWNKAGVQTGASYTGDMKRCFVANGFTDVRSMVNIDNGNGMRAGDVLVWNATGTSGAGANGHTAMFIGNGRMVECTPTGIATRN